MGTVCGSTAEVAKLSFLSDRVKPRRREACPDALALGARAGYTVSPMFARRCIQTAFVCTLAACASSPWTVRVENARDTEVPLVRCAIVYGQTGSAGSSNVLARFATEFAAARGEGAPEVELAVFWVADEPPTRARITQLEASTEGITIRLADPRKIELKDLRGNEAAQLQTDESPR